MEQDAKYFILPIAFDLSRNEETGGVLCGKETTIACLEAVNTALSIQCGGGFAEIVVTAGYVANGWDVVMANVMTKFMTEIARGDVTIVTSPSPTFNTEGEIRQFVEHINRLTMMRRPELVIVVKNWHALRVGMLLRILAWEARKVGRYMPQWTIITVPSEVPYRHRMRELIAIPENFFRIVWRNLRSRR